ncbi:hypothetical protein [Microbacterium oleivorans]|uniref:Uncharacterized protein n=1 Tax=Microbacterium oleivorans TaxID=273677 RepID=A0A031FNP6_9MICO|nr:hypothetical protein [Microbacterium oleivorans]AZS44729.1 hypothetical protein BWL13_02323 [Microbacterium oleivorans]EZP26173.1 hypothetical protein BW34_02505 [Microbacterium oleivorans]THE08079.1 hypothetical protein E1I21_04355 [Microbacterium oleivorans]
MQRTTVWSWLVGGLLLLAQSVLGVLSAIAVRSGDVVSVPYELGAAFLVAVACVVYAFGLRPSESVVARGPGGVAILLALGAFVLVRAVWWAGPTGFMAGVGAEVTAALGAIVSFVLAVGGAIAIIRVGVIPRPWSWIPLAAIVLGLGLAVVLAAVTVVAPGAGGPVGVLPATIPGVVGIVSMVLAVTTQPSPAGTSTAPSSAAMRHG